MYVIHSKNPMQSIWTTDCTQFLSLSRSGLMVETLVFSRGGEGRAWLAQCWEHSPPTKGAMDQFWTQCHIWFEFIGSLHWIVFHCILWFPTSHHKTDVSFYLIKQSGPWDLQENRFIVISIITVIINNSSLYCFTTFNLTKFLTL